MCGLARGHVLALDGYVLISDVMGFRARASTGEGSTGQANPGTGAAPGISRTRDEKPGDQGPTYFFVVTEGWIAG